MGRKCRDCGTVFSTDPDDRGEHSDPLRCRSCGTKHEPREGDGGASDAGDDVLEITITIKAPGAASVDVQGGGR